MSHVKFLEAIHIVDACVARFEADIVFTGWHALNHEVGPSLCSSGAGTSVGACEADILRCEYLGPILAVGRIVHIHCAGAVFRVASSVEGHLLTCFHFQLWSGED